MLGYMYVCALMRDGPYMVIIDCATHSDRCDNLLLRYMYTWFGGGCNIK